MRLEAVNRSLALVLHPPCIEQRAGLDRDGLGLELRRHRIEQRLVKATRSQQSAIRTKAVRSGVASVPEKPQERRKEARSSSASASLTSDRSYQTDKSSALNIANGGQASSPLVAE